jgi:glucosamine-6-phosphate deaminase
LSLQTRTFENKRELSRADAEHAAGALRRLLKEKSLVRLIAATGASQFEFLEILTALPGIVWVRVEMFHLDEYVGLPIAHPASFRKYLLERLIGKTRIGKYHLLDGESDARQIAVEVGRELEKEPVDLAFVGIGEKGHIAFNDPPADFETEEPYIVVTLDEACRRQQVNEGWFATVADVPTRAISMSVWQIFKVNEIIAIVPDARKAQAAKACLEGEIGFMHPASILREHANATIYLDKSSAALLSEATRAGL